MISSPVPRPKQLGTSLRVAARVGDSILVHQLLTAGADVNYAHAGVNDSTALHAATMQNRVDVVQMLLDHGARVNARDANGNTPLHEAVRRQYVRLIELLLRHGADPNSEMCVNTAGNCVVTVTPLFAALEHRDPESVLLLLSHDAEVDVLNHKNESPLHVAIRSFEDEAQRYRACLTLLEHGAQIDRSNSKGMTALHQAIEARRGARLAQMLVERGADIHRKDVYQRTPLHLAAERNGLDLVRGLLEAGASPNDLNRNKRSVLQEAVTCDNEELVKLLLRYGSDCEVDQSVVLWAVKRGNLSIVRRLIAGGTDVNAVDDAERMSLLGCAVRNGHCAVAQCLLDNGADVNLEVKRKMTLSLALERFSVEDKNSRFVTYILLKHIALLAAQGSHVNEKNIKLIQDSEVASKQYKSYRRVLMGMKNMEVCGESSVTYFDLLTKRGDELVGCLRCEGVRNAISSGNHKKLFPKYANHLAHNYRRVSKRVQVIVGFKQTLHDVFAQVLPYDMTDKISEYLIDDLLQIYLVKSQSQKCMGDFRKTVTFDLLSNKYY